jgi:hypothetical protein
MIWSTSYHHVTLVHRSWPHLLFTIASVHRRQVLLKLHRLTVHRSKASDLPFTLATGPSSQASSWSLPPWSHDSMSCLICNEILHDTITCGLIPVYLTLNTISPPKVVTQLPKPNKDLSHFHPTNKDEQNNLSVTFLPPLLTRAIKDSSPLWAGSSAVPRCFSWRRMLAVSPQLSFFWVVELSLNPW